MTPALPLPTPALTDHLALSSIAAYASLPTHGKPLLRANGVPEWTVLASIALLPPPALIPPSLIPLSPGSGSGPAPAPDPDSGRRFHLVALASGAKVLPFARLPPAGDTLHDSHAEVLARRGFKRWLIDEAARVARTSHGSPGGVDLDSGPQNPKDDTVYRSEWMEWDADSRRFRLRPGVQVWMYISTLPCGDASTLHTAALQAIQDPAMAALKDRPSLVPPPPTSAHPHPLPPPLNALAASAQPDSAASAARGRANYASLGQIRTKPGRADAPPSVSLSCSDKLGAWCALGLGGGLLHGLVEPVYLSGVVVGGIEDGEGEKMLGRAEVAAEVRRALWGRLEDLEGKLPAPYKLHRPAVVLTSVPFPWHKAAVRAAHPEAPEPVTSNTSVLFLPHTSAAHGVRRPARPEVLVNGHKQVGSWKAPGLTGLPPAARSRACKLELMRAYLSLQELVAEPPFGDQSGEQEEKRVTYYTLKHRPESTYQAAKRLLRGVAELEAERPEAFRPLRGLSVTRSVVSESKAPFAGWLVSGKPWESFQADGTAMSI